MGFGGAVPLPGAPIGGGAMDAKIQVPGYQGSGVDQMSQAFGNIYKGIDQRNDMLMKNKQLAQQQSQFEQSQAMDQQKLAIDTDMKQQQMKMEREKFATLQKTQMIQQQRDQEKADRERVKSEMDIVDWKNKQAAQTVLMNNLPIVDKLLNDGTADDKVYNSPEYKSTMAALAIVDPKSAAGFFSDAQKRRYEAAKDTKETASYSVVAPIYTEGFPLVMDAIKAGKSITESITPVKEKLDNLYRTGQISTSVYKQTLKDYIDLTKQSMNKLNGTDTPEHYISYDSKGQITTDPSKVARQVSSKTGKVSSIGGKTDFFSEIMQEDTPGEPSNFTEMTTTNQDDFWGNLFGGND